MAFKAKGLLALAGLLVLASGLTTGTLLAQQEQSQPAELAASIKIVPVAANPADPNVIEAVLSDGKTKVQMGTTGLDNVSVGVPVTLKGSATDPKAPVTRYAWTLSAPSGSKAALTSNNEAVVKFTPDIPGSYQVDLVVSNDAGSSPPASIQIRAGTYIGTGFGDCFRCHPRTTHEWSQTAHARILTEEINGGENPTISHYAERCIRCHTTGYYPGTDNGGFADVQADFGWKFPPLSEIQKGKGQWESMPVALQNVANIQCEDCHGPAREHVTAGAKMAASLDEGVCNVCHDGGGHHIKGTELRAAKHSDASSRSWTYPTGPNRRDCVRCHSGAGYISFLKSPTDSATWDTGMQTVTCAVCHDPHSHANKWQLRIVGKPVEAAGVTRDFGLSATCAECHNARTTAADAQRGSFPHYSPAAEMLSDTGGVTYGQAVPNSPHGMIVGTIPVANPAGGETPVLFGGAAPGPCVVCHMWPTPADAKDPNRFKVGEHSFNMVNPESGFQYTAPCQPCHQGISSCRPGPTTTETARSAPSRPRSQDCSTP